MRAVIDTNVWVSAFLNSNGMPAQIVQAFMEGRLESVVSETLLQEVRAVLLRPRLRKLHQQNEEGIDAYINAIRQQSLLVNCQNVLRLCRDERDNFLLETALLGGASCIITRDDDLKRDRNLMETMQDMGVEVLSVSQALQRIK